MKKKIYILLFAGLFILNIDLRSQDAFSQVLSNIELNNTTLKALKEKTDADKIGNKTGINLSNPEVEFGYLWGSPADEGKRVDLAVSQSFDFPTAYRYKSQLSDGKNKQADLTYEEQRRGILQQARLLCVELVYQQKIHDQLTERLQQAKSLSQAYQKSFDQGSIDILEYNKTKLNLLSAEKALQMNEVDMELVKSELIRMNGEQPIEINFRDYPSYLLSINFDDWFDKVKENNPSVQLSEKEIELSKKQEQLTKALNLPKFSLGYTSERVSGTTFQGVAVGVSIPLWEGRNTVKHQKAQTMALQMQYDDLRIQFRNALKNQYVKTYKLSVLLKEYQDALNVINNKDLLKTALDKGQLSLINYLLELSAYNETVDKYLETERDYQLGVAELHQWEY